MEYQGVYEDSRAEALRDIEEADRAQMERYEADRMEEYE